MGYAAQQDAIRAHVLAESAVSSIAWDGMGGTSLTPPSFDPASPSVSSIWIRPSISGSPVDPLGFGSGQLLDRKTGIATVQVFVPKAMSPELFEAVLEDCAAIFRNRTISGFRFGPSSRPQPIAAGAEAPFRQFNIVTSFVLDEAFEEAA